MYPLYDDCCSRNASHQEYKLLTMEYTEAEGVATKPCSIKET